jgi:hypothetical protein
VSWNEFGTPRSIFNYDGYLATGLSQDPVTAARQYLEANKTLLGATAAQLDTLEFLHDSKMVGSRGHAVMFRQTFDGMEATTDGLVTVGVVDGKVAYASTSFAPTTATPAAPELTPLDAIVAALNDSKLSPGATVSAQGTDEDWTTFSVSGLDQPARARLSALPGYDGSVRPTYETLVIDGTHGFGYRSFIDAVTGKVLVRYDLVDHASDNPRWKFFRLYPKLNHKQTDIRQTACWKDEPDFDLPCPLQLINDAARVPWDVNAQTETPNFTTVGNAANTNLSQLSPFTPSDNYRPLSPTREYIYNFTDHWNDTKCSRTPEPDTGKSDVDSAIVNLFSMHNRLHDWQYFLGFTEENFNQQQYNFGEGGEDGDPQIGNAQAASVTGGFPSFTGRDNANQIATPDGVSSVTNMYLWQPAPASFYPPCVDGDFDMTVIGHEYTHATSNRMVAGPDDDLLSDQGGAMGESWSDLTAMEFVNEFGYSPLGRENRYAVGAYVTGNNKTGIRNFGMNHSPLNFSDVGYDSTGEQVHADGEIWSATNYDVRKALMKKYRTRFPAANKKLQRKCALGKKPVKQCPGNRRWIQIVFDAWLLMQSDVSMVDARDAYLAADKMRFKGKDQKVMWRAFAKRGFGAQASTPTGDDENVIADFRSPKQPAGKYRFKAINSKGKRIKAQFFVGKYEARVTPIASNDPLHGPLANAARFLPGRYHFLVRADGYGMFRFAKTMKRKGGKVVVKLQKNLSSKKNGATLAGDGIDQDSLIDDTEATNWVVASRKPNIKGAKITVDLAGKKRKMIRTINVSAMLKPAKTVAGENDPRDTPTSRFQALRRFAIQICSAKAKNGMCLTDKGFKTIYKSKKNAFNAVRPRPTSPKLLLKTFNIPNRKATHIRLVVLTNQCTGAPGYQGDQDSDPSNDTDCRSGSDKDEYVRAAELQVFGRKSRLVR